MIDKPLTKHMNVEKHIVESEKTRKQERAIENYAALDNVNYTAL